MTNYRNVVIPPSAYFGLDMFGKNKGKGPAPRKSEKKELDVYERELAGGLYSKEDIEKRKRRTLEKSEGAVPPRKEYKKSRMHSRPR